MATLVAWGSAGTNETAAPPPVGAGTTAVAPPLLNLTVRFPSSATVLEDPPAVRLGDPNQTGVGFEENAGARLSTATQSSDPGSLSPLSLESPRDRVAVGTGLSPRSGMIRDAADELETGLGLTRREARRLLSAVQSPPRNVPARSPAEFARRPSLLNLLQALSPFSGGPGWLPGGGLPARDLPPVDRPLPHAFREPATEGPQGFLLFSTGTLGEGTGR